MSSVLLGGPPLSGDSHPVAATPPGATPPLPPGVSPSGGASQRNNTLTIIAGVGVLLLAMGVGVLIGRAGSKQTAAPAQVISVASPAVAGTGAAAPSEATFTSSWPSGTTGYTVQLQALPQSGTSVGAVGAAKSADSAKGATAVGALKSEEFSSLTAGSYVIYSGVYHKRAEAEKALAGLKKSFPNAKVVAVSNGSASASVEASGAASSPSAAGKSESHPAPASVLKTLKGAKGKSYEERSKSLPDVVETG